LVSWRVVSRKKKFTRTQIRPKISKWWKLEILQGWKTLFTLNMSMNVGSGNNKFNALSVFGLVLFLTIWASPCCTFLMLYVYVGWKTKKYIDWNTLKFSLCIVYFFVRNGSVVGCFCLWVMGFNSSFADK